MNNGRRHGSQNEVSERTHSPCTHNDRGTVLHRCIAGDGFGRLSQKHVRRASQTMRLQFISRWIQHLLSGFPTQDGNLVGRKN
jgi:hypothetical protein